MSLGVDMRRSVRQLLDTNGADVTFRRATQAAYDPDTGGPVTGATTDDETARVAFIGYSAREIDQGQVERGDRRALVASVTGAGVALTKEPRTGDQFLGEGDTVNVVASRRIVVDGTIVAYECQVRE